MLINSILGVGIALVWYALIVMDYGRWKGIVDKLKSRVMKIKIDALDKLFSKYIRLRAMANGHGCERCGSYYEEYKRLQCSHFFGRGRKSVRWDEDNATGLCFGCHQYFTSHPLEYVEWFKARLGDRFELLLARMRITHPKPDKALIELYLKAKIDELIRGK